MMKNTSVGLLVLVAVIGLLGLAVDDASAQTYGGTGILKIKPGARATGMGQAGVAVDQRAHSVWWNPALLARTQSKDFASTIVKLVPDLADDVYYLNMGFESKVEGWGGLAFDVMYLSYGKTEATNEEGESHGFFSSYEMVPTLGFGTRLLGSSDGAAESKSLLGNIDVGVSVKYILVDLAPDWAMAIVGEDKDGRADAFAVDFGALLDGHLPITSDGMYYSIGACIQNLGSELTYIDADQADPLPRNLKFGFGLELYNTPGMTVTAVADFNKSLIEYQTKDEYALETSIGWADMIALWNYGAEVSIQDRFYGRVGYVDDPDGEITDWTFGIGMDLDVSSIGFLGEGDKLFRFDFSSVPQALDLDRVSYLTLGVHF